MNIFKTFFLISLFILIFLNGFLEAKEGNFTEVNFKTSDNGVIYGSLFGKGEKGVILAHGKIFNKESWYEFAEILAVNGFQVLAFDFRGYGMSKPGKDRDALELDILGAEDFLRKNNAKKISVIGASMGARAALKAAISAKEGTIQKLVLLSPPPLDESSDISKVKGEKLFIASKEETLATEVKKMFIKASGTKELKLINGSAHAQNIFKTEHKKELEDVIIKFLKS